jgi:putative phage-type endonuclease
MDINKKDMTHEQWLSERSRGIGGSDGAAIMGMNPYKTADQVYAEKKGEIPPAEDTERMEAGRRMEPVIAEWYADREGERIANVNRILVHDKYDFIRANVDRRIVGKKKVLECKNVDSMVFRFGDWGEEYTDQVPEYYYIQGHHYTLFPQFRQGCDLAAVVGGNRLKVYRFEYDQEIADMMIEVYAQFWKNFEKGIRPEPQNLTDLQRRWKDTVDDAIEATPEIEDMARKLSAYKTAAKNIDAKIDAVKFEIQKYMEDHAVLNIAGKKAHSWKWQTARRFDTKAFQKDHADLYEEYKKESSTRVFR